MISNHSITGIVKFSHGALCNCLVCRVRQIARHVSAQQKKIRRWVMRDRRHQQFSCMHLRVDVTEAEFTEHTCKGTPLATLG